MENSLALNIRNLSVKYKVYEGILEVIPGLSLQIKKGERVGLIGEAGCGKTTVLIQRVYNRSPESARHYPEGWD